MHGIGTVTAKLHPGFADQLPFHQPEHSKFPYIRDIHEPHSCKRVHHFASHVIITIVDCGLLNLLRIAALAIDEEKGYNLPKFSPPLFYAIW